MNKVKLFEKSYIESLNKNISLPAVGDLVKLGLRISEGSSSRIQNFEGICIGINKCGVGTNILVKKETSGIVSCRMVPIYSPNLEYIEVIRSHKVRRAKLYYLLNRIGKKAKLAIR